MIWMTWRKSSESSELGGGAWRMRMAHGACAMRMAHAPCAMRMRHAPPPSSEDSEDFLQVIQIIQTLLMTI